MIRVPHYQHDLEKKRCVHVYIHINNMYSAYSKDVVEYYSNQVGFEM